MLLIVPSSEENHFNGNSGNSGIRVEKRHCPVIVVIHPPDITFHPYVKVTNTLKDIVLLIKPIANRDHSGGVAATRLLPGSDIELLDVGTSDITILGNLYAVI